jgi:hypothetical protein
VCEPTVPVSCNRDALFAQIHPRIVLDRSFSGSAGYTLQVHTERATYYHGLSLECQRDHRGARRDVDFSDLVDEPAPNGVGRVLRGRLSKQWLDIY